MKSVEEIRIVNDQVVNCQEKNIKLFYWHGNLNFYIAWDLFQFKTVLLGLHRNFFFEFYLFINIFWQFHKFNFGTSRKKVPFSKWFSLLKSGSNKSVQTKLLLIKVAAFNFVSFVAETTRYPQKPEKLLDTMNLNVNYFKWVG